MHDAGEIDLINYGDDQWFTHTAAAGRQYIEVLDGKVHIPEDIRPAAIESDFPFPDDMASPEKLRGDIVIVEVSSLKQHQINGIELNAHKVYKTAAESVPNPTQVTQGNTSSLPDGHVLKGMQVNYVTQGGLATDLLAIRDRIGSPVMTVNHLHSVRPDGSPAPERTKLTEALRAVEANYGIPVYDTKDAILEQGADLALLDQNHYRPDFEIVVGRRLLALAQQIIAEAKRDAPVSA